MPDRLQHETDRSDRQRGATTGTLPVVPPARPAGSYSALPANRKRGGGIGCWITALVSLAVAGALIGAALLLPPFNLLDRVTSVRFIPLTAAEPRLAADGLVLAVTDPGYADGFSAALSATPLERFLRADAAAEIGMPPAGLALQSAVYTIETRGPLPTGLTLALDVPPGIRAIDLLDLYGVDEESGQWTFIPAQRANGRLIAAIDARSLPDRVALFQSAAPEQPRVVAVYDVTERFYPQAGEAVTIAAPAGMQPLLDGRLTGSLAPGHDLEAPYRVMPVIRNFSDPRATDPDTVTAILNNAAARSHHAAQIAAFAATGFDGVLIDYRDLPPEARPVFSALIREIALNLRGTGLALGVIVPEPENRAGNWETGAYDWRELGRSADLVIVRLPLDPQAFAPGPERPVEALLRWAVGEIPRQRLIAALPARSLRQVGGAFTPIGYDQALSALGDVRVDAERTAAGTIFPGAPITAALDGFRARQGTDDLTGLPFIDYYSADGARAARMWLTTPDALRYRIDRTIPFALSGIAFEDLLSAGPADGVLDAVIAYRQGLPAQPGRLDLGLRWTIEGANTVLGAVTTGLDGALVATIEAPDGSYAVNVAVVNRADGGQPQTVRGGAAVAVFAPTLTPTPLPTATPTPIPAPTSTPAAVAAAPAQNSGGGGANFAAVAPGAGSIVAGQFEYGGHVTSTSTGAAGAMRSAGMTWMKVQIRYSRGNSPGIAADAIAGARAQGFRILLGVVGYPAELAAGGASYVTEFANFLGGVAALGPDAIEVWNEPNIDREWPTGMISGALYADMLRQAYNAIKSANSGVMVISGAPAPTGAEAAYPGQVVNDDNWIRQMVEAGGLNAMDCLGAHYNEGITPPSARSGDPRDNYYTRYFWGMLDTYWNLIGGQRPICFTELGYLTPEGYGPLPSYFAWAQNVTLAQHAAWLAEAAALASQSGRVRLMIIWNVDFTAYGSDPMGGYAIIRPDGSCPACSALAGAR
ncbi:MAG: hypothetical protein ACUVS2_11890 [Candidatus Flexifilum sp.]